MLHNSALPSFAVYKIIMLPSQGSLLTDTSLPFVVQGLQPGGIWSTWSEEIIAHMRVSWWERAQSKFQNLEPLLSSDDCFILLFEKILDTGEECGDLKRSQDSFPLKRTAQYQDHIDNKGFNLFSTTVGRLWTVTHFYFGE